LGKTVAKGIGYVRVSHFQYNYQMYILGCT